MLFIYELDFVYKAVTNQWLSSKEYVIQNATAVCLYISVYNYNNVNENKNGFFQNQ